MSYNIAINGYGRIGRNILRAIYERGQNKQLKIVAINDLADIHVNAHLTQYDSVHGQFSHKVDVQDHHLCIDGDKIAVCAERNPEKLPWKALKVDLVLECTGLFASRAKAEVHLKAGASKVLISAPAGSDVKTIVYGVNHHTLTSQDHVVSNASCTTNCLAPLAKVLHEEFGIIDGVMLTVHAYTNDQMLTDSDHKDLRRARSATQSMIPTKTGAASALGLVLPELDGKLDGYAIRVPTINVSALDLTFSPKKTASVEDINAVVKHASEAKMQGILGYNDKPLVSVDFNHDPRSSIFDAEETRVQGGLVKVLSWYDNEWGFSNRMIDTALALLQA